MTLDAPLPHDDLGLPASSACVRVLDAMGISAHSQAGYLDLVSDVHHSRLDERQAAELVAAHLVTPETHDPLPLGLATKIWSARREAELAEVVMTATSASEELNRRRQRSYVEILYGMPAVVEAYRALQHSTRALLRTLDRPPYLSEGGPVISDEQAPTAARGVEYRTIYLASNLHDERIREVIRTSIALGEQARIEHDLPIRMLIADADRALLVLPRPCKGVDARAHLQAVVVHASPLLDGLIRVFETTWAHALPIDAFTGQPVTSQDDRQVLAMLSSGMTDARIATALGVSERTVARRVAALQERLAAPSRFVLGVRAAQEGLV